MLVHWQELGCFQLPGIVYRSLQLVVLDYHDAARVEAHERMAKQWSSCPGGWSHMILEEYCRCCPGLVWLHVVCGDETGWMYIQIV